MMLITGTAFLSDPTGDRPLVAAVQWLQQTLLGTVATTLAVIAVASVGLLMLTGRIDIRRGITVVMGCFILFGASSIVAGVQAAISGSSNNAIPSTRVADVSPLADLPTPGPANPTPGGYDPYAGAAVPMR